MENCLVTKLKSSVDNSTLPILGSCLLKIIPSTGSMVFEWFTDGERVAKVLDENMSVLKTFNEANKNIAISYDELDNSVAYLQVPDWYNLKKIQRKSGQLELRTTAEKIGYCTELESLSPLYTPIIEEGYISQLPKKIKYYNTSSSHDGLSGSIMDLLPFSRLLEFKAEYSPNIDGGVLENFCEAWYNPSYVSVENKDLIIKVKSLVFNSVSYTRQQFTIRQGINLLSVILNGNTLGTYNGSVWNYS